MQICFVHCPHFPVLYFDSELIKENPYPDILISILAKVFEYLLAHVRGKKKHLVRRLVQKISFGRSPLNRKIELVIKELEKLRAEPQSYDMMRKTTRTQEKRAGADVGVGFNEVRLGGKFDQIGVSTIEEATETTVVKIARLQQNLESYHNLIIELLDKLEKSMVLFIDDFYFITKQHQPNVIDYLHRVCKGTNMFIKLGTIRYRTMLYRMSPQSGRITGVELDNDIFSIDLDYTLEDMAVMLSFLDQILRTFAEKINIQVQDLDTIFTDGGKKLLHLSSGGVPRDFLNLFLRGQGIASKLMLKKLEKRRVIGEAARQYLNEVKKQNFSEDSIGDSSSLEQLIERIRRFAIEDRKKTVILIDQEEQSKHPEEYDKLKQLMDLRFVHLVDSNTSATYGRRRRFEGYMVDAGLWASPRIPGLVEVDFGKRDASGRKDELRNCPIFRLT